MKVFLLKHSISLENLVALLKWVVSWSLLLIFLLDEVEVEDGNLQSCHPLYEAVACLICSRMSSTTLFKSTASSPEPCHL